MEATQFTLRKMFEHVTLCSIILGLGSPLGVLSTCALLAMTLSLMLKRGIPAILALSIALLGADVRLGTGPNETGSMVAVVAVALAVTTWSALRHRAASAGRNE